MSESLQDSSALIENPEDLTSEKKRKQSEAEELTNYKKSRNDTGNTTSLNKIINFGMPHIGEQIFESIVTPGLFQCALVSETWKVLAENVLIKRWKDKMIEACKSGETKVVQLLLKCSNSEEIGLNTKDEFGCTPFMWACENGHKDIVKLLLDHSERIELNARDNDGKTAFMIACKEGHKNVVKLLLDHYEKFEVKSMDGWLAFYWACENGHKDVVKLLLDYSDRFEHALNACNRSSLKYAHGKGHKDIVRLIRAKLKHWHGPNPDFW